MDSSTPAQSQPGFRLPASHEAFVRANRVIPGGVNSPARAFGAVGGEPPFMASALARISTISTATRISTTSARGAR